MRKNMTAKILLVVAILALSTASAAYAQQQIIHTVTAQNKSCNTTCSVIDVPELNGNPVAGHAFPREFAGKKDSSTAFLAFSETWVKA